jgi:hypothetical protein
VDVEKPLGRALSRTISAEEMMAINQTETGIDSLIGRRSKMFEVEHQEYREEAAWKESTRRHDEQRRQQARLEWHLHHTSQAARLRNTLEDLIAHHEQRAEQLMSNEPKGAA